MNRPYLETKIVKVRSEKKKEYCPRCGSEIIMEKVVGNWVNGECIDKIKFPCFCSFSDGEGSKRKKGFLSMNNGYYYITNIDYQKKIQKDIAGSECDLKVFITKHNIHILKGKIIIFEEEK